MAKTLDEPNYREHGTVGNGYAENDPRQPGREDGMKDTTMFGEGKADKKNPIDEENPESSNPYRKDKKDFN